MSTNPNKEKIAQQKQRADIYSAQEKKYSDNIHYTNANRNKNNNDNNNNDANIKSLGHANSATNLNNNLINNQNIFRQQSEHLNKVNDISGLDVSLIEKKQSLNSELSRKDYINSPPFIPAQTKKRSNSFAKKTSQVIDSPQLPSKKNKQIFQQQEKKSTTPPPPLLKLEKSPSKKLNKKQQFIQQSQQQSLQKQSSSAAVPSINWSSVWQFVKLVLFSYQFNLIQYLTSIDKQKAQMTTEMLKIAPGYKPIQYVYTFYMLKYGIFIGITAALIYPLPYSILFLMITSDLYVPLVAVFMLAGMRSSAIALLLKYCLHFPKKVFHWAVFIFTILIGLFLQNNYIFLIFFVISIFLSFYINQKPRTNNNQHQRNLSEQQRQYSNSPQNTPATSAFGFSFNQQQIYKEYKVYDNLPETYPNVSVCVILGTFVFLWVLNRYYQDRELNIFGQVFPISLLTSSKEMLGFFPFIYNNIVNYSTLSFNTLIALSFLFPGPHSKAFMFFIFHTEIKNVIIGYLCLYTPSILLANIFIGYRPYFFTKTYYNIRQSIQAVGNGIVFCLVYWMLQNQKCFFNSVCYSAVVIMVVAKLYKLRQLFAITLGIFLISARTIILNINKGISFQEQACLK